jgi:hypothetical protein
MALKSGDLTQAIEKLSGEIPTGRQLSEKQKDELIKLIGVRTARSILQAKKTLPLKRIPFLFSSIDTQLVMDLLENDVEKNIEHALDSK